MRSEPMWLSLPPRPARRTTRSVWAPAKSSSPAMPTRCESTRAASTSSLTRSRPITTSTPTSTYFGATATSRSSALLRSLSLSLPSAFSSDGAASPDRPSAVSPRLRKCSTSAARITSPPMSKQSRSRRSMKLTKDCSGPMSSTVSPSIWLRSNRNEIKLPDTHIELEISFVIAKRRSRPVIDRKVEPAFDDLCDQRAGRLIGREEARARRHPASPRSRAGTGTQTHFPLRGVNRGAAFGVRHTDAPLRRCGQDHVELARSFFFGCRLIGCATPPVRKTSPFRKGDACVDCEHCRVHPIPLNCHGYGKRTGVIVPLVAIHGAKIKSCSSRRHQIPAWSAAPGSPGADQEYLLQL